VPLVEPWPFCGLAIDGGCETGLGIDGFEDDSDWSGIIAWTLGGKIGSSGCRIEAWRRRDTKRACGRVEKYARF
jgi:hypothetical protein